MVSPYKNVSRPRGQGHPQQTVEEQIADDRQDQTHQDKHPRLRFQHFQDHGGKDRGGDDIPQRFQRGHVQDKRQDDDDRSPHLAEGLALAGPSAPGLDEEQDGERDQNDPVDEREEAGLRLRRHPDLQLDGADHKDDPDGRESKVLPTISPGFRIVLPAA